MLTKRKYNNFRIERERERERERKKERERERERERGIKLVVKKVTKHNILWLVS